jgi:four helix bundle protein
MSKNCPKYDLEDRLIDFAVRIIRVTESLPKSQAGKHIAGQLLRSGTAPAANYGEAQGAESRIDFIHKMKLSLKELRETRIWLVMIVRSGISRTSSVMDSLIGENDQLISIFVTSIKTAQSSLKSSS